MEEFTMGTKVWGLTRLDTDRTAGWLRIKAKFSKMAYHEKDENKLTYM